MRLSRSMVGRFPPFLSRASPMQPAMLVGPSLRARRCSLWTSIGPPALAGAAFDSKGNISSLIAGTQFLFNGVAAPIVYVSAKQSSVIVPYEVASASTAQIVAVYNGAVSVPITVPVVAALPGI